VSDKFAGIRAMQNKDSIKRIKAELEEGIKLTKCKKCGCMKDTLEALRNPLSLLQTNNSLDLLKDIDHWLKQMQPIKYACLGCEYCFPAVAMNIFNEAFPEAAQSQSLTCAFEVREQAWPPVPGEYFALCDSRDCRVAVSTLASVELAEELASIRPKELCIVGKTETENIGIDKIIKNTITNPTIHFLVLAGKDPKGHYTGKTLLALRENGVDDNMRVIGSPSKRPFLRNVTLEEVESFRKQVQVVDLIGIEDIEAIVQKIKEISKGPGITCSCQECHEETDPVHILKMPVIRAEGPTKVEMDKAGYFVVIPQKEKGDILVEHYSYDNKLQRVIEGKDARIIYWTIIENGWVTQLSHAAYLGKELAKAELSMKYGFKYTQDGA
jgi:tetrahydromethanopterin S-methyltransferase subunit A